MTATRLSDLGSLLADQTRCQLLVALMDGRAWTAGELARCAGVTPSTASAHLSRLLDVQFVAVQSQGRHRYFRLSGASVAELVEVLAAIDLPELACRPRDPRAPSELRAARSCYDHLAGRLAVSIYDRMLHEGHLLQHETGLTLSRAGCELFTDLGVEIDALHRTSRALARPCLDWTERRHHLAGSAATALFDALILRGWIRRGHRPRAMLITRSGHRGFRDLGWATT